MTPRVSVVIPTYRRPDLLQRCLSTATTQRLSPEAYEVIVVDDGHDDETRRLVESIAASLPAGPALRYLRPDAGRGPAVARNAGWRAARAPLIAFTDDDTLPDLDWLPHGERAMGDAPSVVAMCGKVVVPMPDPPTDHARMTEGLSTAEFVTANAFVRTAALQRIDGFDERFTRAWREDSDLQFRLMAECGPVGRCADACVVHPVRQAPWGISLRQQRNNFFEPLLFKKHPRLYRERILPSPPWSFYLIVVGTPCTIGFALTGLWKAALVAAVVVTALVLRFAARRLERTARTRQHVLEMLLTSALIPFASIYWRLRGAWHFRVPYL